MEASNQEKEAKETKTRRELLEENLLSLGFRFNPGLLKKKKIEKIIASNFAKRLLAQFIEFSQKNPKFQPAVFREFLPPEMKMGFADMMLSLGEGDDAGHAEKEIESTMREINIFDLKEKLTQQAEVIREAEKAGDRKKLKKAENFFAELSKSLKTLE